MNPEHDPFKPQPNAERIQKLTQEYGASAEQIASHDALASLIESTSHAHRFYQTTIPLVRNPERVVDARAEGEAITFHETELYPPDSIDGSGRVMFVITSEYPTRPEYEIDKPEEVAESNEELRAKLDDFASILPHFDSIFQVFMIEEGRIAAPVLVYEQEDEDETISFVHWRDLHTSDEYITVQEQSGSFEDDTLKIRIVTKKNDDLFVVEGVTDFAEDKKLYDRIEREHNIEPYHPSHNPEPRAWEDAQLVEELYRLEKENQKRFGRDPAGRIISDADVARYYKIVLEQTPQYAAAQ